MIALPLWTRKQREVTITLPDDLYGFLLEDGKRRGETLSESIARIVRPCQKFAPIKRQWTEDDDPDLMTDWSPITAL